MERPEGPKPGTRGIDINKTAPKAQGRYGGSEGKDALPRREGRGTWTHLWLGVGPPSGSAGTGGDIRAISALSPRGTRWHPGGRAEMGALWFKPTCLLTPPPNTPGFWMSRGSRAPNSTRCWQSKKGKEPVALQGDVFMSLSLPGTGAQSDVWQCPARVS